MTEKLKWFWILWIAVAMSISGKAFLWAGGEKIVQSVSDFEKDTEERVWKSKNNAVAEISEDYSHSRKFSLKYNYDLSEISYAWIRTDFKPPLDVSEASGVKFWVKGDGSNNFFQAYFVQFSSGKERAFPGKKIILDFNDWKEFFMPFYDFSLPKEEWQSIESLDFHILKSMSEKMQSCVYIDDIDFIFREVSLTGIAIPLKTDLEFFSCIDTGMPGLEYVKEALNKKDFQKAKEEFVKYMRFRPNHRYFFDLRNKENVLKTYYEIYGTDALKGVIPSADKVLDQDFTYEGFRVKVEGDMMWDSRKVNTGWVWGSWITRMQFLVTLGKAYWASGDEKYSRKAIFYIEDYNKKYPLPDLRPARSIEFPGWGWGQSLHVAERLDSWIAAYHYFVASSEFTVDKQIEFFKHLIEHAQWLYELESFGYAVGNFQIVECGALAQAGIWFSECKFSKNWTEMAVNTLWQHLKLDTLNDGAHSELTPGYHGWCVEKYMKTIRLAQVNNIKIPDGFVEKLSKMFEWYIHLIGPDSRTPAMGDSGRVNPSASLQFGALLFNRPDFKYFSPSKLYSEWFWFFGPDGVVKYDGIQPAKPNFTSSLLPNSQYIAMRSGWESNANYLFFDCAPYGGGHSHPDVLSIDVTSYGRPMIVDPGAGGYARDEHNLFHRKTKAHSIIMIDGKEQSVKKPVVNCWKTNNDFDFAEGIVDYGNGIKHTRRILFVKLGYFIIYDLISGSGEHNLEQIFRFAKGLKPVIDEKNLKVLVDSSTNSGLLIEQIMKNNISVSDKDGLVEFDNKSLAAIFSKNVTLPAQFLTLIYPLRSGQSGKEIEAKEIKLESVKTDKVPPDAVGLSVFCGGNTDCVVIQGDNPLELRCGKFTTNERIALWKMQ